MDRNGVVVGIFFAAGTPFLFSINLLPKRRPAPPGLAGGPQTSSHNEGTYF